ncbi:energy transducer TonB [Saccharospirillum mangrovi]|uniref:energy transducer TonB n=1 Tax=Saccharospirillum mangrovi TaxID=2161747 RepID=UPI000D3BDE6F|nr:energy transducer TonB [Saccharospirillum mangrovi]
MAVSVGAVDRLSFTLFVAVGLHALVIFGVGFEPPKSGQLPPTLDVTLAQHASPTTTPLDEADFLADANQQGSGTLEDKAQLTSTEQAEIEDNQIFRTVPEIQQIRFAEQSPQRALVTTTGDAERSANAQPSEDALTDPSQASDEALLLSQVNDIATLRAMLDESRQNLARAPRTRTLTAVSARQSLDAAYVYGWLEEIERIGNQNYPQAARQQRLTGDVRLAVTIRSDGTLANVAVTRSSGHAVLDQAAQRIVHLAAPFEPFTLDMRQEYDQLEIIRTWQFRTDNRFGRETP